MSTAPVAVLLLLNILVLIGGYFLFDKAQQHTDSILFSLLFLCSGMPALIYQIVWQRVLFSIYGVNSQSVAVVVTAFMLGLGLGSLAGGRLSARPSGRSGPRVCLPGLRDAQQHRRWLSARG